MKAEVEAAMRAVEAGAEELVALRAQLRALALGVENLRGFYITRDLSDLTEEAHHELGALFALLDGIDPRGDVINPPGMFLAIDEKDGEPDNETVRVYCSPECRQADANDYGEECPDHPETELLGRCCGHNFTDWEVDDAPVEFDEVCERCERKIPAMVAS